MQQSIGERFEEARKRKGISIREAAEATKIRGDYLQKFESNQFSEVKLPDIYIRGFLRIYAHHLKLPAEKLVNDYLALGLGEGGRPAGRGLGREVYGRMEISHTGTTSPKGAAHAAPSSAAAAMTPGAEPVAPQRAPFQPRMPLGGLDRAMLAKNGPWIALGAIALCALVIWGVVALLSGGEEKPAAPLAREAAQPPVVPAISDQVFLVALAPVQVTGVKSKGDGRVLAPAAALTAGQRLALANVPMLVAVSAREAVQIEFRGARYAASGANVTGPGTLDLDFSGMR